MKLSVSFLFFLLILSSSIVANEKTTEVDFKKLNVISKFLDKKSADELVYSLKRSGQDIRLVSKQVDLNLKSLSVGLFDTKIHADSVVKHLASNKIDSFVFKLRSGKYRVHAGAIEKEDLFWSRYEKLVALGYKKPHTSIKVVKQTEYYIVSDKKEDTSLSHQLKSVIPDMKNTAISTEFHSARFKGEFSIWGDQGDRSSSNYFNAALSLRTIYQSNLDFIYGGRFDATEQSSDENIQKFEFDWKPTYMRFHEGNRQWMVGAIDARWETINPNTEHESLSERLSSKILVRYKLDYDLTDKHQPVIGTRWKFRSPLYELDVMWLPFFRPAKLPDFGSIWHPVRRSDGAIRGIEPTDQWAELVKKGSFADEKSLTGGIGVRISHRVGSRTRAATLQYTRQNEPYYALNSTVQQLTNAGTDADTAILSTKEATFTPEHPYTGILTWEESSKISHFEFAISTNTPYSTRDYEYKTAMSMAWRMGFIYPKTDRNVHLSGYFTGHHINTDETIIDRKTKLAISGEVYTLSKSGFWKFGTSYEIGLDHAELFLNPRLTLQQSKYVQIFLNYLLFTGSDTTESGYHTGHSILSLTWQANF